MCFVIKKPIVTAGLKCAMDIFPKRYILMATPTKGAKAINGIPSMPFILASKTTEPVAKTTTINVPITSARNFFWLEVSLLFIIFINLCCKLSYFSLYLVSDVSYFLNLFPFWIFYIPVYYILHKKSRTCFFFHTSHIHYFVGISYHIFCKILWFLFANIYTKFSHDLYCKRVNLC